MKKNLSLHICLKMRYTQSVTWTFAEKILYFD